MSATSVWPPSFTTYNWEDYKVGQSLFQELDLFSFLKFYLELKTVKELHTALIMIWKQKQKL